MCVGLAGSYSARSGAGDSLGHPCGIFDALVCDGRRVLGVLFFSPHCFFFIPFLPHIYRYRIARISLYCRKILFTSKGLDDYT